MERLETKRIHGHSYYYYSKWEWQDGKCRRVWQKYLGKPEDVLRAVEGGGPCPRYAEVFQWTDSKIEVHALYCTIAVLLRALLWRRVRQAGLRISLKRLLGELQEIREIVNIYPARGKQKEPRRQTILSKRNEVQE